MIKSVNVQVKYNVQIIRENWEDLLKTHGYSYVEEDLTSTGQWPSERNESRDFGKVAFWKERDLDGIIISEIKFCSEGGNIVDSTTINTLGDSNNYFKELGYKDFRENHKKVVVNGRGIDTNNTTFHDGFYNFLSRLNPIPTKKLFYQWF